MRLQITNSKQHLQVIKHMWDKRVCVKFIIQVPMNQEHVFNEIPGNEMFPFCLCESFISD